jgi:hypothetical protein
LPVIDDSNADDERDPTEIVLQGEGPFILPFCDSDVEIGLGDAIVLLTMTTLDGQELQIPFGLGVLKELHALTTEALAHLSKDDGETLQ